MGLRQIFVQIMTCKIIINSIQNVIHQQGNEKGMRHIPGWIAGHCGIPVDDDQFSPIVNYIQSMIIIVAQRATIGQPVYAIQKLPAQLV